jgi:hypothetical protein
VTLLIPLVASTSFGLFYQAPTSGGGRFVIYTYQHQANLRVLVAGLVLGYLSVALTRRSLDWTVVLFGIKRVHRAWEIQNLS